MSRVTISNLENGIYSNVSLGTLRKLAFALDVPLSYFFNYTVKYTIQKRVHVLIKGRGMPMGEKSKNRPALMQRGEMVIILMVSIITAVMASLLTIMLLT